MPARGASIYDSDYRRRRDRLVAWGYSNPHLARCWQCNEPLTSCGPNRNGRHVNGRPAKWTGGHRIDGDRLSPLALECSPCNYSRGAAHGARLRSAGRPIAPRRPGRRRTSWGHSTTR